MPFRKRAQPSATDSLGSVSADALLLAATAAGGDDQYLDAAISLLLERGGFDALQLNNDDTFLLGQLLKRRYDATGSLNDLQWGLNYMLRGVQGTPRRRKIEDRGCSSSPRACSRLSSRWSPVRQSSL